MEKPRSENYDNRNKKFCFKTEWTPQRKNSNELEYRKVENIQTKSKRIKVILKDISDICIVSNSIKYK